MEQSQYLSYFKIQGYYNFFYAHEFIRHLMNKQFFVITKKKSTLNPLKCSYKIYEYNICTIYHHVFFSILLSNQLLIFEKNANSQKYDYVMIDILECIYSLSYVCHVFALKSMKILYLK